MMIKRQCRVLAFTVSLTSLVFLSNCYGLSVFYCGFSGDFCGQSNTDDTYPSASLIILAFANTLPDGSVIVDEANFPASLTEGWKKKGKDVVISVGGQNGNWAYVFSSEGSINNFVESLSDIVKKFRLNGVDLDIESYLAPPRTVATTIQKLKKVLNQKVGKNILIVSPEDVSIYQGAAVPSPDSGGQPFNYFVPIVNLADDFIDLYQPQAYNNWYDGLPGGSLDYYRDVYLNWRNLQGLSPWAKPLQGFSGISPKKLRIGLLASPSAGQGAYYGRPQVIIQFKDYLKKNNFELNGFMIWDSHWDKLNDFSISKACTN